MPLVNLKVKVSFATSEDHTYTCPFVPLGTHVPTGNSEKEDRRVLAGRMRGKLALQEEWGRHMLGT